MTTPPVTSQHVTAEPVTARPVTAPRVGVLSKRVAFCVLAAIALSADVARPCGGAEIFAPLPGRYGTQLELLMHDDEGRDHPAWRFFEPFRLAADAEGELLAAHAAPDSIAPSPMLDTARLDDAIRAGHLDAAVVEARRIIDAVLSLPSPAAQELQPELRRAVELVEAAPALVGVAPTEIAAGLLDATAPVHAPALVELRAIRSAAFVDAALTLAAHPRSPRRPSLELAVLRNRMTTELPNGWPPLAASAATWRSLLEGHDAWLRAHATHPLADLARLQKLRVLYLKGDGDAAWRLLLELYARRPARAAWEMRHLLRNDVAPPASLDVAVDVADPVLATALVHASRPLSPAAWTKLWRRSLAAPDAPWATNLQERLLLQVARQEHPVLPAAFPERPGDDSVLWAELRTLALARAGRGDDAVAQAAMLRPETSANVIATAWMAAGKAERAAAVPGLDGDTVRYLLHVEVGDAALRALARDTGRGELRAGAAQALALRVLHADGVGGAASHWRAGADVLATTDQGRAARWRDVATRAADVTPRGRIALAAHLLAHRGALMPPMTNALSRGLKSMLTDADTPAQRRLRAWLLRGGERQWALHAYADALAELPPTSPAATTALREADRIYNTLLNADASFAEQWPRLLDATADVQRVRQAGVAIRKTKPR